MTASQGWSVAIALFNNAQALQVAYQLLMRIHGDASATEHIQQSAGH